MKNLSYLFALLVMLLVGFAASACDYGQAAVFTGRAYYYAPAPALAPRMQYVPPAQADPAPTCDCPAPAAAPAQYVPQAAPATYLYRQAAPSYSYSYGAATVLRSPGYAFQAQRSVGYSQQSVQFVARAPRVVVAQAPQVVIDNSRRGFFAARADVRAARAVRAPVAVQQQAAPAVFIDNSRRGLFPLFGR